MFIGAGSGLGIVDGYENIIFGNNSMAFGDTSHCIAMGAYSLQQVAGVYNIGIGEGSGA